MRAPRGAEADQGHGLGLAVVEAHVEVEGLVAGQAVHQGAQLGVGGDALVDVGRSRMAGGMAPRPARSRLEGGDVHVSRMDALPGRGGGGERARAAEILEVGLHADGGEGVVGAGHGLAADEQAVEVVGDDGAVGDLALDVRAGGGPRAPTRPRSCP